MIVHQVYAQIHEQVIKNIIVCDNYTRANYLARATYGEDAFAVDCLQYPCCIGDTHIDGVFYREDGTIIEPLPTQEQEVSELKQETETMAEYQVEFDYRISCQELGL